jgi:ribosomal protein L7Ae-like RNA K-turn-binding protein
VKEVVKCLRKGEKGLCIIAGDISPIDVISHLAVYCEELAVPYIYVNSKVRAGWGVCALGCAIARVRECVYPCARV